MKYESNILERLIKTYGVVGNPKYVSEIIKEFILQGKECYPNLFTYQADWLAHIDEFGLNPTYTVSYTGQSIYAPNTLEKPVKSAILTGQTLVNLVKNDTSNQYTLSDGHYDVDLINPLKNSTTYTLIINVKEIENSNSAFTGLLKSVGDWGSPSIRYYLGINKLLLTTNEDSNCNKIRIRGLGTTFNNVILLEGDYTNIDIPYFTGMQSVKLPVLTTTGKNLFDGELEDGAYNHLTGNAVDANGEKRSKHPIRVNGNVKYYFSSDSATENVRYYMYDENMNFIGTNIFFAKDGVITTVADTAYMHFRIVESDNVNIQIEHGAQATSYEPYKTNILTVNEEVVLRGIGDVKDTLNCLTGEVTQRIGEIVLDGSENWVGNANFPQTDTHLLMQITLDDTVKNSNGNNMVCDKMQATNYAGFNNKEFDFVCVGKSGSISNLFVKLSKDKLVSFDKNGFNNYFSQNPITVQYQLATESIKTVDLTILDQNGQSVDHLKSFNGGTHFNTGSLEGSLLPSVSVCVETDLEETLKVCSLEGNTL